MSRVRAGFPPAGGAYSRRSHVGGVPLRGRIQPPELFRVIRLSPVDSIIRGTKTSTVA